MSDSDLAKEIMITLSHYGCGVHGSSPAPALIEALAGYIATGTTDVAKALALITTGLHGRVAALRS